jgi:hypothetical protein
VVPDAKVIRWASKQVAPYRKAHTVLAVGPMGAPMLASAAMAAGATAAAKAAREYTPFEVQRIQAA